jgi:hypothetical protein
MTNRLNNLNLQITTLSRTLTGGTFACIALLGVTSCLENTPDDRSSSENPPLSVVGQQPTSTAEPHSSKAIEGNRSAVRVYIDSETGELRAPTPPEKTSPPTPSDTTKAAHTRTPPPKAVTLPDGTISITLGAENIKQKRIHVCPDGSLAARCIDTPDSNPSTTAPSASNK